MTRIIIAAIALTIPAAAHAAGVTNAADDRRTGWYPDEASLSPSFVAGAGFVQQFSTPVEGQVYAQPLVINRSLFVATEENWIYRLDPESGAILWSRQVAPPWNPADIGCGDLTPWIGITGTPVVDESTNTAYFFSKTYASGTSGPAAWFAHAVDLITGDERPNFPVEISGTAQNSPQMFDADDELQRPGLLLMNGIVYAGFGGHCDIAPWQGWIAGVSTSGVLKALWTSRGTLGGNGAAIWQSGGGLVSDGAGRIIVATGNGGSAGAQIPSNAPPADLGEAVARLNVQADGTLAAADFFSPWNGPAMDVADADLGSGGPIALPDAYFGTTGHPHLALEIGKQGILYVLDRDVLGGCQQATHKKDDVINEISGLTGVWARPSCWPGDGGYVYFPTNAAPLRVMKYGLDSRSNPTFTLVASSTDNFGFGSSSTVVTSNGTTSGSALVWTVFMPDGSGVNAALRAYDAVPSAGAPVLRYSAPVGTASKFNPPGIGFGRVYVGARDGHVLGFGPVPIQIHADKAGGSLHLSWTGGNAPFTLRRAEDPDFKVNPVTLVDHQAVTSFDDPALSDGKTYYYDVR
ncbi:MAG TPA: hypothetical protein VFV19_15915 [Candidatus Polarisedimenticolaceae bacterium]|nr:hypothetical protein [Candidatus Polarisedimenticolaceae bacterium]